MKGLSPQQRRALILSVGTHRDQRPLSPVEAAELIGTALKSGSSPAELASELHLEGTSMLGRFTRLLGLAPVVRHLIDWGRGPPTISLTVASEIARLSSAEEQETLASAALEHGLATSEIKQIVQVRHRSGARISDCIESIIRLRPQIDRKYLYIGAVTNADVQRNLDQMTQSQRDILFRDIVEKALVDSPPWSGRLGVTRFTLIGDDALGSAINRLEEDFESTINRQLVDEVANT